MRVGLPGEADLLSGRDLIAFLVNHGHHPDSVSERQRDLEDIFLSLTEDKP